MCSPGRPGLSIGDIGTLSLVNKRRLSEHFSQVAVYLITSDLSVGQKMNIVFFHMFSYALDDNFCHVQTT